jgi:fructokinase
MAFIGIEIGGTKAVIAHGSQPDDLSEPIRVPTTTPKATVAGIIAATNTLIGQYGAIDGIGIASFGPISVSRASETYGRFLNTPKPGFSHFDLLTPLRAAFPDIAFTLDTDVNGAAIGEGLWGAAIALTSYAYITVGTGIGVGLVSQGAPVHGLLHPEAGHILIRRDYHSDPYTGHCPFHGDCLEGLASGPAIAARMGKAGEDITADDPVWDLAASYIAELCYNLVLIASPERIMLGGGVGSLTRVLEGVRTHLHHLMGIYIEALSDRTTYECFVCAPGLGDRAGVLGAIALARRSAGV